MSFEKSSCRLLSVTILTLLWASLMLAATRSDAVAAQSNPAVAALPGILCLLLCEDDSTPPDLVDKPQVVFFAINTTIPTLSFENNGGVIISDCAVSPTLPAGMAVQISSAESTCDIVGTPIASVVATLYSVTATNRSGSSLATVTIGTGPAPILADEVNTQEYILGNAVSPLVFSNSGGVDITACSAQPALPSGLFTSPTMDAGSCQITGTPVTASDTLIYAITGQNTYGSDTASVTISVTEPPMLVNETAPQAFAIGQQISPLVFINTGGTNLSNCAATPLLPAGLFTQASANLESCEIIGLPVSTTASASYIITANNIAGSDTATVTISTGETPSIEDIAAEQSLEVGVQISPISFTNTGGTGIIGCGVQPILPSGLMAVITADTSSCEITGTPVSIQAPAIYTVTSENQFGSDSATVTLDTNQAPVIADQAAAQELVRTVPIDGITFTNTGGANISACSSSPSLPTGLITQPSSDDLSCEIIGTPTALVAANNYTITATNSIGSDTATINIAVITGFLISGKVNYDRIPTATGPSRLDYNNITETPVRAATVQLLDNSNGVIDTTTTDGAGDYLFGLTSDQSVRVRVRAELLKTTGADRYDVKVVDNTMSDALYTLAEANASLASANAVRNLTADSGWDGSAYTSTRASGPFALLDSVYEAVTDFIAVDPNIVFPPLQVNWSVNNTTSGGNTSTGSIGTSFYSNGNVFILGAANNDTDEFDDHVVIHEWGHYFEDNLSRSDSIGGQHGGGDRLDMRVAFGEGYGNALSGIITDDPLYVDTRGAAQAQGFTINVDSNNPSNPGWYSEGSVQSILYDLYDSNNDGDDAISLGLAPLYNVLIGAQKNADYFTSIFTFISALKNENPGDILGIDQVVNGQAIDSTDINETGSNEDNDVNGTANVLPIYTEVIVDGASTNICTIANFNGTGERNKLSNRRYLHFSLPSSGSYTVTAANTSSTYGDTDPDFRVFESPGLFRINAQSGAINNEIATQNLNAGLHIMSLLEFRVATNPGINTACFDVTISSN